MTTINEDLLNHAHERLMLAHLACEAVDDRVLDTARDDWWAAVEEIARTTADTDAGWAIKAKAARLLIGPGGLTENSASAPLILLLDQLIARLGG